MLEYSNTIMYIKINYHCRLSYMMIFTSTNWCMYNCSLPYIFTYIAYISACPKFRSEYHRMELGL